jgi:HD-GYP domain-containing protein (c-di-GMP phosphodiesterase class II)
VRLVATRRLDVGAELARDVVTGQSGEVPLLRAGVRMSASYRDALLRAGVHAVYVEDELGQGIDVPTVLSERTRDEATAALARAFTEVPAIQKTGSRLSEDALDELNRIAAMIASDVASCGEAVVALNDLAVADAYTLQHSIDVAAVGIMIGHRLFAENGWINFRGDRCWDKMEYRLTQLGLGLLLHDIGKMTVPSTILNKPGSLDDSEWELMKQHPEAGIDLLPSELIGVLPKVVVRQHHERWDGAGYPDGRAGDMIHQFARIASVADVYDAVTSARAYAGASPAHVGVAVVEAGVGSAFDPEVVDVFRRVVPPFPPGIEVELTDGRRGVVSRVPTGKIDRPLVRVGYDARGNRIEPYEVDLAVELELGLTTVDASARPAPVPAAAPQRELRVA